jgi:DNA invertase Pin-like site-specific DNA recombinase
MKVVAYYRVSTDKQAQSGLGLEAQIESVQRFCKANGHTIVSEHTEAGVSGKSELSERPALLAAIAAIQMSSSPLLVAAKIDRLSRDVLIQLTLEKHLSQMGARFVSAAGEGTEDDSPQSQLLKNILSSVSQMELAMISLRTKAAMKAAKRRGVHLGRPPLGMMKSEGGGIIPGPEFFLVVRMLFARFQLKWKYREIIEHLNSIPGLDKTHHYKTVYDAVKRWGNRQDWYSGIKSIEEIQPEMDAPPWLSSPEHMPTV